MLDQKNVVRRYISEARERVAQMSHPDDNKVPLPVIWALCEMVLRDVRPDGTFSDAECCAWDMIYNAIRKAKEMEVK